MNTLSTKQEPENRQPGESDARVSNTLFSGGGEMGSLMRAMDWSATPVGDVEHWPQSLKTAVRIILTSRYAMFVWWGRELVNLYNDPYRTFLGIKHPQALGRPAREVWSEIWDQIGPRTDAVLLRGESTYDEALLLLMGRHGYLEETYFTFSYSPLPDDEGNVGGLFCAVTEETEQVIGERRLRLLREVAAATAENRTPEEVCRSVARCLSGARRDLPFSLIYLLERDGKTLKRAGEAGISADHPAAPDLVYLDEIVACPWPLRQVLETGEPVIISNLHDVITDIPKGEWDRPPQSVVLLPLADQGQARPAGVFIAGLNPHRSFGDDFKGFVSLLANQTAAAIANAVAFESERRRAEALADLDRAKTLFFSNVSHEFRTPLTLMLGPLEEVLPEAREKLSPEHREQLDLARRNALRLLKLVNTLLDFSRIEAGRLQAVYEPTDICTFTADIASAFRSAMERAGLRFTVACHPIDESIYLDRDMWEKIVLNLISNAFKFTFEGEVALTLRQAGDSVELAVRDTGVGIPPEELSRVFERFHRIESARARTYEGTGIGLALVHELVKLHGGTVRAESTVGQGSTFTVSIPRGKAHLPAERIQAVRSLTSTALSAETFVDEAERWLPATTGTAAREMVVPNLPSVTPEPAEDPARELIVLADDNADMRQYLARLLRHEFRVHAVADGEQAVEAARRLRPALVLADGMMPRLDGFGVVRAIRSDPSISGTPVILLSARAGEESRVEGLQAGADDYLVKPFTARELLARVGAHVKVGRLRRQAAEREAQLRREAELARQRVEELLAQAPAAIALLSGPEHRWTYVNDQYLRVTGRKTAADFIGRTLREGLPEFQTQPFFIELMDRVYLTGQPCVGREMLATLNRGPNGKPEEVYFDFVYQPVRDALGQVEGILVHAVEVTDKVRARESIEKSEERLRLAQTAAQIGTWEWDSVQNAAAFSAELHDMFATDPADPHHAELWVSRVHPDDWPRVQQFMMDGLHAGNMEFEYRYDHPQLGLRWYYCKGRRLQAESRMFGVIQDVTDRKRAEEALRDTEERFRAIVDTTPECVNLVARDGTLIHMNSAGLDMVGADSLATVAGKSIYDLIAPEDRDRFRKFNETICDGGRGALEFDVIGLNRVRRHMETHAAPLRNADGSVVQMAVTRDVTVRRRAEEARRQSEEEFRNLANAMPQLVWMARPDGYIFWYNQRWYEYTGTTPEQVEGWGWQSVHDPGVLPAVLARWRAAIDAGESFEMTFPLRGADGVFRPFLTRGIPIRDQQGKITRWFGTNTDVSREVKSQERLQTALLGSQRLAAIVESSDDAIVSKDLNGIITSWNPCAQRMFGYTAEEMIGRSITTIIPPELHAEERRILETIGRGDRIEHFETVRVTKSGERIQVSLTISPVKDENGKIVGAAKIARDITQHKKAERALHMTERLASVGRLAATVAHEINNPLEAVTNLVYLAREAESRNEVREYLAAAEQELDRISHLTRQTLGFYRETRGARLMKLSSTVDPLVAVFAPRARNKKIDIHREIKGDPEIYAVPGEIRQLLANLISNSIDAVDGGGRIRVRVSAATERDGRHRPGVRLTVADTGPGIAPALRSQLFEPFFTTKKEVGTGLGLWVCKSIVDKHQGSIRLKSSTRPGKGWTVFSVFLPANTEENSPPVSSRELFKLAG